jgi:hypothetical protein
METSSFLVKGYKILAYARLSGFLSRKGSLSCHTYFDTGPRFFRSHPKDPKGSVIILDNVLCGEQIVNDIIKKGKSTSGILLQA